MEEGAADKIKEENKGETDVKVDDKDRKKHEEIGDKIKAQLQETEGKDILELQKNVNKEGENLEDKYQPSLKKGINLDVKTESADKAKKDGDVDVTVEIKPNDYKDVFKKALGKENVAQFKKLYFKALNIVGEEMYVGYTKHEYKTESESVLEQTKGTTSKPQGLDEDKKNINILKENKSKELEGKKEINEDKVLKSLSDARIEYSSSAFARYYDNNVFNVYGKDFFIDQSLNYYIYPNSKVTGGLYYHKNKDASIYKKLKGKGRDDKGLTKEQIKKNDGNYLIGPSNPEAVDNLYDYNKLDPNKIKFFKNAINNINTSGDPNIENLTNLTIFLAALIAEPSRAKFAAVEHLKEIYRREDEGSKAVSSKGALTMTRGGSDTGQEKLTSPPDEDLEYPENEKRKKKITDAVFNNLADDDLLFGELSKKFLGGLEKGISEEKILDKIIEEIKDYLKLIRE